MKLIKLACPACGAPLSLPEVAQVLRCPFCETRTVLAQTSTSPMELPPECRALPRASSQADFERALLRWLSEGDYTPDDILQRALVTEHAGLYAPFWLVKGEFRASFTAAAGFDRVERTEIRERGPDGRTRTRTERETVTDWRPMSGEASGPFSLWLTASGHLPEELRSWAERALEGRESELRPLDALDLAGSALEEHALDEGRTLATRGQQPLQALVESACKERVPGDRVKDLRCDFRTEQVRAEPLWAPFWLARFDYGGQAFSVLFDGQDLSRVEGRRPVDGERKARIEALHRPWKITALVTLVLVLLGLCSGGVLSVIAAAIGLPLGGFLFWRARRQEREILERSREVREQVLARLSSS